MKRPGSPVDTTTAREPSHEIPSACRGTAAGNDHDPGTRLTLRALPVGLKTATRVSTFPCPSLPTFTYRRSPVTGATARSPTGTAGRVSAIVGFAASPVGPPDPPDPQ